jgi:hypothetical protein
VGTQKNDRLTYKNDRLAFAYKDTYMHTPAAGTWFWLERGSRQGGAVVL